VVSKFEKRLIQAAKEAVAFARGELDPKTYRVHHAPDDDAVRMPKGAFLTYRKATSSPLRAGAKKAAASARKKKHPVVHKKR
jgi:hypothetical protein